MLNRVVLVGRLTKDIDLRYTPQGKAVGNFNLAVNRPFNTDDADFPPCVVWEKKAENAAQFTRKGSLVGIDGRLQTRSFDNSEGKRVFVTEVVCDSIQFLDSKGNNQQNNQQSNGQQNQQQNNDMPIDIDSESLPF